MEGAVESGRRTAKNIIEHNAQAGGEDAAGAIETESL